MVLRLSMTGGHTCGPEPADGQSIRLPPRLALKAPNRYRHVSFLMLGRKEDTASESLRHRMPGALRPPAPGNRRAARFARLRS